MTRLNKAVAAGAIVAAMAAMAGAQQSTPSAAPAAPMAQNLPPAPPPDATPLTLDQAVRMAIRNNPHVSVAHLIALAQGQMVREARSGWMPTVSGDLTAVDAHDNTRITAGVLNNPSVYDRAGGGLTVTQLITDFGRTHNLVRSERSNAQAQLQDERATDQDITLAVDHAFYRALTAQAVLRVAQETVAERRATADQIGALARANLRSGVDLNFAKVQLAQAKLLLLDARNESEDAMAALNTVLGSEQDTEYALADPTSTNPAPPPQDAQPLVQEAMAQRPDLAAAKDSSQAAMEYSRAERDLWMPRISALAAVGGTPVRSDQIQSSWYGAAGANINIPVFNGFLYNAREQNAKLRANAAEQRVRVVRDRIARDVRTAVLDAQNAFQRIAVTQEMLQQSNMALELTRRRYKLGLSSIVELTEAQLAQTQSKIAVNEARYNYATARAVLQYQLGL